MRHCERALWLLAFGWVALTPWPSAAQEPGTNATPKQLMTLAVERAVAARGLSVESGSVASGHFVTAPAPLDPARLSDVAVPAATEPPGGWARAAYQVTMRLSIGPNGGLMGRHKVDIRAWPAGTAPPSGTVPEGVALASTGTLEQEFMKAIGAEVDKMAHLFPPDPPEPGAAEPTPAQPPDAPAGAGK